MHTLLMSSVFCGSSGDGFLSACHVSFYCLQHTEVTWQLLRGLTMSLSAITFLVAVYLALIPQTTPSCTRGSPRECKEAEFAPGSNLAGEGFDITKMQRKGAFVIDMNLWRRENNTCMLCRNPYQEGKMQKVPAAVVDWRPSQKCSMKVASSLHQSSESLVSSSASSVENNWKVGLNLGSASLMLAGTNSKLSEYSMEKTKRDKFTFSQQKMSCSYYSYRVSNQPQLHPKFQSAINQLPKKYTGKTKHAFYKLINNFGTHFIPKVTLGGMVQSVTSIRQCMASLQGLSSDEIKMCLDVEAEASIAGRGTARAETKHCQEAKDKIESKNSFSSSFSDRFTEVFGGHTTEPDLLFSADKDPAAYKEWLSSLPLNPDMISYSLDPLHELLSPKLPVRKELRKAIKHYILESGLWQNCSEPCKSGVKRNPKESCVCSCHGDPGVGSDCCPVKRGLARVIITAVRASGLWGDTTSATDAYVKVFNSQNMQLARTHVIWNNNSPQWNMPFDIGDVILSQTSMVKFEVWDEDSKWDDDLLGTCTVNLKEGTKDDACSLNHGMFYYKLQVVCGPSLSGKSCSEYVSSPMNSHLERLYVSRNARPVPKDMLKKMGVFGDEH
ncbi:perforin-1-like isoform X2 [Alosa pseudoharengus]|uniref:perforin-1-like isoform X2 n=1 Tax=Alosa pseudoharengus TaxID=34774 RepID=UPI003F8C74A7